MHSTFCLSMYKYKDDEGKLYNKNLGGNSLEPPQNHPLHPLPLILFESSQNFRTVKQTDTAARFVLLGMEMNTMSN